MRVLQLWRRHVPFAVYMLVFFISNRCVRDENLLFVLRTLAGARMYWKVSSWIFSVCWEQCLQDSFLPSLVLLWRDPCMTLRNSPDLLHFVLELVDVLFRFG